MNGLRIGQGKVRGESLFVPKRKEREVKTGRDMRGGGGRERGGACVLGSKGSEQL